MSSLEGEARMAAVAGDRKTLEQRSETRDGMRIDWDVPIAMDDGLDPARRRVPAHRRRPLSGHLELRPLRQGACLPGRLSERLAAHGRNSIPTSPPARAISTRAGKSSIRRNGCRTITPACASICAAPAARRASSIHFSPRETKDFYDCIEWAGAQPWSNGKVGLNGISYYGINQWHVASLRAAASCRHVHLGRRRRLVSRHDAPWRHSLDVLGKLVRHAGQDRAVRRRRARQAKPRAWRAGVRARDSLRRRACEEPQQFRRRHRRASVRRRLSPRPLAGVVEGEGAVSVGGQLGRAGAASRAAISKVSCAPRPSKNGSKSTASSIGRISTPITAAICSCASSTTFCTARRTAGTSSRRCSSRSATSTASSSARKRNGRSSAPNGPSSISTRRLARSAAKRRRRRPCVRFEAMGDGVTFLTPPLHARYGNHRAVGGKAVRFVVDQRRRYLCRAAGVLARPEGSGVSRRHRSAYAGRPGLAARLASRDSTRNCRSHTGPITLTPRSSRLSPAKWSRSISRSGRPRLWCRPAIVLRLRIRGKDYVYPRTERRTVV